MVEKQNRIRRILALAKSIGSDFQLKTKEIR
jgi:hypothetical protein